MDKEFFKNLPSDIIIDILSRLPVRRIVICKCVCKSWLKLLGTHEFAKLHLSRSIPGLALCQTPDSNRLEIFEFKDDLDLEHHDLHYRLVTKFDFPHVSELEGSANGLLFLVQRESEGYGQSEGDGLYICNPITRDYTELHCPTEFVYSYPQVAAYGFGASKLTGQHKVVRIFHDCIRNQVTQEVMSFLKSECHVYTLETGSWRSIVPSDPLGYGGSTPGASVNGNIHWLVRDLSGSQFISCFDLETELFSTFSCPLPRSGEFRRNLSTREGCLCLCEHTYDGNGIVFWLMKEYGVEKSWTKEFVISSFFSDNCAVCPIKVFKDGDILMAVLDFRLLFYCTKTKTIRETGLMEYCFAGAISHTPSFLSLQSFGMENDSYRVLLMACFFCAIKALTLVAFSYAIRSPVNTSKSILLKSSATQALK